MLLASPLRPHGPRRCRPAMPRGADVLPWHRRPQAIARYSARSLLTYPRPALPPSPQRLAIAGARCAPIAAPGCHIAPATSRSAPYLDSDPDRIHAIAPRPPHVRVHLPGPATLATGSDKSPRRPTSRKDAAPAPD